MFAMEGLISEVSRFLSSRNRGKDLLPPAKKREIKEGQKADEGQSRGLPPVGAENDRQLSDNEGHDGYYWS